MKTPNQDEKEEIYTCPLIKEKKFFPSNEEFESTLKPDIKILQSPNQKTPENMMNFLRTPLDKKEKVKSPIRSQRKSLSGVFDIGNNPGLKQIAKNLTMIKSNPPENNNNDNKININNNDTIEDDLLKSNRFLKGIQKIEETVISSSQIGENASKKIVNGKTSMSEIILSKEHIQMGRNLNLKKHNVSISDKDHLTPQNSPYGRASNNKMRMSIKKGESKNMIEKSPASNDEWHIKKISHMQSPANLETSPVLFFVFVNILNK